MIHMHYFELCFPKSRGFAGVRLWLGDYHYPYSRAAREEFFSETQESRRHREEGPGAFTVMESQKKGAPVPRQLRTHHQNNYACSFIPSG